MQLGTLILTPIFFLSCNNADKVNTVKSNADSSKLSHDTTIGNTASINKTSGQFNLLVPGKYSEEVSLAVDKDLNVTGTFEFYGGSGDKYKANMGTCIFYFSGHYNKGDSSVAITWGWPKGEQSHLIGRLRVNQVPDKLKIGLLLNDAPDGYAEYDFTEIHGYERNLDSAKNWIQVRIIKAEKARLYESPDTTKMRKAYLVKDNVVKVLEKSGDWYSIEYRTPYSHKSLFAWLKEDDLYKVDY